MKARGGYDRSSMRRRVRTRWALPLAGVAVAALALAACGGAGLPASSGAPASPDQATSDQPTTSTPSSDEDTVTANEPTATTVDQMEVVDVSESSADLFIDATGEGVAFDRRLLGTNVPAWIRPSRLADPDFRAETMASGTTLLRMPGGSWSNAYDWRACELADENGCHWPWAARPTDFVEFMDATGLEGMWTVSINDTAQSASAAVAFFNGEVGDETLIGVDRNGVDWGTVDTWATLRVDNGNAEPARIQLWEVGNEVYGGRPDSGGSQCASWGWEDVWTCDGTDYVTGDAGHDGYLAIRDAMIQVDPTIEVGAVGVPDPDGWENWGNEVIEAADGALDFYVVHQYGFSSSPSAEDALARPGELWPAVMSDVSEALDATTPIAVTEYNLVSIESRDTEHTMTKAMNALYIADTIGRLATHGATIANQWNLANGTTSSGTDYGMLSLDGGGRFPQFEAMAMWSLAGTTLLEAPTTDESLRVYPTRHDDGRVVVLVINLGEAVRRSFEVAGLEPEWVVSVSSVAADDLEATTMERTARDQVGTAGAPFTIDLPGWSINAVEIGPSAG